MALPTTPDAPFDALVIGGSFAGLSAATYIARARRTVAILDTGLPRNRFADQSHGVFTHDGGAPGDMLAAARRQVDAYPTAHFVDSGARGASRAPDGFVVETEDGRQVQARALVLAFGISDELPDLPGLAERWGHSVIHCPYCHGFEFSDRRLGVLHGSPMSSHQAMLVAEWGPTTYYLNGASMPDAATLAELRARGVTIEPAPVAALHGQGKALAEIALQDGRSLGIDALYIGPRNHLNSSIAQDLGCALDETPLGQMVRTDAMNATTVPGVFAAGDITRGNHAVTFALADGVMAGTAVHRSLVF